MNLSARLLVAAVLIAGGAAALIDVYADTDAGARQVAVRAIEGAADGPRSWALVIGVSQYEADEIADLKYAAADARALVDLLRDPQRGGYGTVVLLSDDQTDPALKPTVPNIIGQLQYAKNHLRGMDRVLVSFSGHGGTIAGQQCLLASDTRWVGEGPLANDLVRLADVTAMLDAVGARQSVVVMDACRNELTKEGKSADAADGVSAEFEAELGGMARGEGRAVIASAKQGQKSYEWEEQTHGVFTYYLMQAIGGDADDDNDGAVTLSEANGYLASAMQQWSAEHAKQQSPAIMQSEVTGEIVLAGTPRAPRMGTLSVVTEPEGATVFVDGREVGVSPLQVGMSAGEHQLMARATGFAELARPVIVASEGMTPARLTLSEVAGSLTVTSQPDGGAVYVDGVERGLTPLDIEQLAPGEHAVRVAMADHFDYEATASVGAGANTRLTGLLQPLREARTPDQPEAQTGFLYVTSEPEGVEVWMDGRRAGVTPLMLKSVDVGEHLVQLRSELWEDTEFQTVIGPMKVAKTHRQLTRAQGEIKLITDMSEARVELDGQPLSLSGHGETRQTTKKVVAGKHTVQIQLGHGWQMSREILVPKGQEVEVALLAADLTGGVTVFAPGDAQMPLWLDGADLGVTTPATVRGIGVGPHRVCATPQAGAAELLEVEFEVTPGQVTVTTLAPVNRTAAIEVSGEPEGAEVYLDGTRMGRLPMTVTVDLGAEAEKQVSLKVTRSGYFSEKKTFTVARDGKHEWQVTLDVKSWQSPGREAGDEVEGPGGIVMVWVPGGSFMMGSEDGHSDEKPVHRVELSGFWIGKTEVTIGQWRSVMGTKPRRLKDESDDHPMRYVAWWQASRFCNKLGVELPTEAQWEYAARGSDSRRYPWGDTWDEKKCCNEDNEGPGGRTFPVGSFPSGASWCGALDMAGNVYEWCADWYNYYYGSSPARDPAGPPSGSYRVLRGGSWCKNASNCRSAYRSCLGVPTYSSSSSGFRISRSCR